MMKAVLFLGAGALACIGGWYAGVINAKAASADTGSVYDTFELTDSGWLFSDKIGSGGASPIERARIALGGPLGLSASEVIYFIATVDSKGEKLSSSCHYKVSGEPIDTRWWSLTLYDFYTQNYVPNDLKRSSFNNENVPRAEDGSWVIEVAGAPKDGAWLPSQPDVAMQFELNLRMYNPSEATRRLAPNIELPVVEEISC